MIRLSLSPTMEPDAALVADMIDALDRGLYRVAPTGPIRMTPHGIATGDVSEWTEETLDLSHAAGRLMWHPLPAGPDEPDPVPRRDQTIRREDPEALPDIRLVDEIEDLVDHSTIVPGLTIIERIRAAGAIHAAFARQALACRRATDDERHRIVDGLPAVAASILEPGEAPDGTMLRASNGLKDMQIAVIDDAAEGGMRDCPKTIHPEILALVPPCVSVAAREYANHDGISYVEIGPLCFWLDPDEVPTPVETLRILASLRKATT